MKGVANAPLSFGVFELTADGPLPEPDRILRLMRECGYDGVDLGPVGWLGRGADLQLRLREHGMALAGGWVELPFADDQAFQAALPALHDALDVFVAAAEVNPDRPPLPTLADAGSDVRRAHPGGAVGIGLDETGWDRLAANVATAAGRVRATGLVPTFHPHACTYVETPAEIDNFLARTDGGMTFDTGHLLIGGIEPTEAWRRWEHRINHVHLKDVRMDVLSEVVRECAGKLAVWQRRAFVALGGGDVDVAGLMEMVTRSGFNGWLVVEQDVLLPPGDSLEQAAEDQRKNRDVLRRWAP